MLFHRMISRDIRKNLATENYLMTHYSVDEPILLMYIQEPSIIIGKHQNIYDEVDLEAVKADSVVITRRLSGGGAVYDDLGNISFSFVVDKDKFEFGNYPSIIQPIILALKEMGVEELSISGRNDLMIGDKKISGNAMYTRKNKMFSHGTLLHDVDLDRLSKYLTVSKEKLGSKHIKSVSARVTNIKPHLDVTYQQLSTEEFRDELLKKIYQVSKLEEVREKEIKLTLEDNRAIEQSMFELYANQDWLFGYQASFTIKRQEYITSVGLLEARFQLRDNKIHLIDFVGDFFNQVELVNLKELLEGVTYTRKSVEKALEIADISQFFSGLTKEAFISFLLKEISDD